MILHSHRVVAYDDRRQRARLIAGSGGAADGHERRGKEATAKPPPFANSHIERSPWRKEARIDVWMPATELLVPVRNDCSDMYVESISYALIGHMYIRLPPSDRPGRLRRANDHPKYKYVHICPGVESAYDLHRLDPCA